MIMKKYMAELLGTFALVLFGTGAATISGMAQTGPAGVGILGIALAFGLTIVAIAYAIGNISGCHINPAVTIAMFVAAKMDLKDAIGYIIAQMIGAVLASAVVYVILIGRPDFAMTEWALGSNGWGPGYLGEFDLMSAFITELVLTFLFIFVIFAVTSKYGNSTMAGLAIGVTLVLIHLFAIPITGTSVNPARSLGPALFAGGKAMSQLWLFFVAPIIGGLVAAFTWKLGFEAEDF